MSDMPEMPLPNKAGLCIYKYLKTNASHLAAAAALYM